MHTSIWQNLTQLSALLQEHGLVVEFNGKIREVGLDQFEICSNQQTLSEGSDKDSPYYLDLEEGGFYQKSEYANIDRTRNYTLKFLDGGILQYFCVFKRTSIEKQRLCFYQSPLLKPFDEMPSDYSKWLQDATDLNEEARILFAHDNFEYRDVGSLRIEYAPNQFNSVIHPKTHIHLNSIEGCRIPVKSPLGVANFLSFIIKNFYSCSWPSLSSKLKDKIDVPFDDTIDKDELKHLHLTFQ